MVFYGKNEDKYQIPLQPFSISEWMRLDVEKSFPRFKYLTKCLTHALSRIFTQTQSGQSRKKNFRRRGAYVGLERISRLLCNRTLHREHRSEDKPY